MIIRRMAISHVKCLNGSRLQQTISIANFLSQSAVVWDKSKSGAANYPEILTVTGQNH